MAGKSPAELYQEREKRLRDAIELKIPDRVPIVLTMNYFPATYVGGLHVSDAYYNPVAWREATRRTLLELVPDIHAAQAGGPGSALGLLEPKLFRWAGDGLGPDVMHQFLEGEPLAATEYEEFLHDPGDFTLRKYLPRVWKSMEPLAGLPSLQGLWGASTLATRASAFSAPGVARALETLIKAGKEQEDYARAAGRLDDELSDLGFPSLAQGNAAAPFDVVSDHLRGMAGAMTDLYRHPDELARTCEMILRNSIAGGLLALQGKRGNPKRVGSALHRGSDGFMTLKHFEKFYWSTFKKLVAATTGAGLVHIPFYEGNWEQRLEFLLELPRGKTVARFALTDLDRAKAVLKDHSCIMGGVPHGLLQVGSPSEVEEYCVRLIRTVGKGGGFIMTTSTGVTHEARPENVRAMIEATRKYGRY